LQPHSITKIDFIFKPEDTDEDEFDVLKEIFFTFAVKFSLEFDYAPSLNVRGRVLGPSFQLDHKIIDIGLLYLGEFRNVEVNVTNTGIIAGKIFFQKPPSTFDGIIKVSSKNEIIKANEFKTFKFKFLAKKVGKFMEQTFFKVKNGERLSFIIQGTIKALEIVCKPERIAFSSVSMCIPQISFLYLSSNLPFDVNVHIEIENCGSDDPLEFIEFFKNSPSISDSTSDLSSISKSPSDTLRSSMKSCSSLLARTSIKNFMERSGKMEHLRDSVATQDGLNVIFSKVDDYLERREVVKSIIEILFDNKVNDELEKRLVASTIVELLIENIKECEFMDFITYSEKEWKISRNPRQMECNKDSFILRGNGIESVDLKVFLTPNIVGKFTRNMKIKLIMSELSECARRFVDESVITIPIMYNCQIPEIKIHDRVNAIEGYAESEIKFTVLIENASGVDGFFLMPKHTDTDIIVKCNPPKFHISSMTQRILNISVMPLKSGHISKYVSLMALGSSRKYPINIECKSLPPDIVIKPNKIFEHNLEVLKHDDTRIFIENRSSTKARFFVKLEHDSECFNVNPCGGILSSKQCAMVMLQKFFYDPGNYRDILVIEIVNSKIIVSFYFILFLNFTIIFLF
jgi:hypothetical protein